MPVSLALGRHEDRKRPEFPAQRFQERYLLGVDKIGQERYLGRVNASRRACIFFHRLSPVKKDATESGTFSGVSFLRRMRSASPIHAGF
jgi:hypothetical protein